MNLKIEEQHIRMRISACELETLLTESQLIRTTLLPGRHSFDYGVYLEEKADRKAAVILDAAGLILRLPRDSITDEDSAILSRQGLQGQVQISKSQQLAFSLQVDLRGRKSKRR